MFAMRERATTLRYAGTYLFLTLCALEVAAANATPPVITPDSARLNLDDVGLYDLGYQYRGRQEVLMPLGWSGPFEARTGVACMPAATQNGRRAFLLHPPWRGGTGVTFQEFELRLPKARRILLSGATAMRSDSIGRSDGAVFRIYVDGHEALDDLRQDSAWKPFSVNLTSLEGKTVRIRFETDPGPQDNASFDFALWGDRALSIDGFHLPRIVHPAPPPLNLRALWSKPSAGVAPLSSGDGVSTVRCSRGAVTLGYNGGGESLVYTWRAPTSVGDPALGKWSLRARLKGDSAYDIPLAGPASLTWDKDVQWVGNATFRVAGGSAAMTRHYRLGGEIVTLTVLAQLQRKSLVLDVSTDKPSVVDFDAGMWGPLFRRRAVTTPYYSGQIYFLPRENLFVNAFLDWTGSNASSFDGARAHYDALTSGSRAPLKERIVYAAAWNFDEVLPNVPNPASPYRAEMGGRLVLDVWGGRYTNIANDLQRLAGYGIRNGYLIIHDWQRDGYDNALPAHLPAAADKGGDEGMRSLVSTAKQLGYRVALHENYVDYYPNYEHFDENDIALDSHGQRQHAWFNGGTGIQSFAVKPTAILRLASTQSPEIQHRYGSNANYLDVHSAVAPWFHVDDRASEPGAGKFETVRRIHSDLWAYERNTFGGPVTGEGNNHWYWSGLLDGVEAQFGAGWESNQGMAAPVMVDFDLLRIHPLQINHGMGYYERWWGTPTWRGMPPMVVLDQYRMQEVAFGHAAFLGGATWNNLPFAWLEHHLVTPVARRYAAVSPTGIRYFVGGRWVDPTAAAKAGAWDTVRVRYSNGLTVTANNSNAPIAAGNVVLSPYGWHASGAGVTAYTGVNGGAMVDYAETANSVFSNARSSRDWSVSGTRRVRPEVESFEATGARTFSITFRWRVREHLAEDYMCFVHFGAAASADPKSEIISFQGDHEIVPRTSRWPAIGEIHDGPHSVRIPDGVKDGDYKCSVGLYGANGRLSLQGVDDGRSRIVVGVVHIRDDGATVTWSPQSATLDVRNAVYSKDTNSGGPIVDFGPVRTDGSVLVERDGPDWVLRAFPRDRAFHLDLSAARFGRPVGVRAGSSIIPTVRNGPYWSFNLNGSAEYRWPVYRARIPGALAETPSNR